MNRRCVALIIAAWSAAASGLASPGILPVYIEENHAGSFYWLAGQIDLDEPCTLVHFDAHSDASGVFDSDQMRTALRSVGSADERKQLLDRWRGQGRVQSFNWIEPLMPSPIGKVVWVPAAKLSPAETEQRAVKARAQLDGHLEAAPRMAGSFRALYFVSDLATLVKSIRPNEPLIVTIDLDYFSGIAASEQAPAFDRAWDFVLGCRNLRAVTFAISSPYLKDEAEGHRLLHLALKAALNVPGARIQFEPYGSVPNDHSVRAHELAAAAKPLPAYQLEQAPEELRATILAQKDRFIVKRDRARFENCVRLWGDSAPRVRLEIKNGSPSTDGVWRLPVADTFELLLLTDPWMARAAEIEWSVFLPKYPRCNVTDLTVEQVGFVADAAPRPAWTETVVQKGGTTLPLEKIDHFFDSQYHCGSLRLRARARVDGSVRETPVLELRRYIGNGFRAALSEQFQLPYLFGSGQLRDGTSTGPETDLGADCANFVIDAFRRGGVIIPWSDPKNLRKHLELIQKSIAPGEFHVHEEDLDRGLIVHLGTHVAAVVEDRPTYGLLDGNDLVAHQLKGYPEFVTLGELLHDRKRDRFDLLKLPAARDCQTIVFGGDVMLSRSCGEKIEKGLDPFAGVADLLRGSAFVAANLECVISRVGQPDESRKFSFRAPLPSVAMLRAAGFRAVSLANNHAFDFGAAALRDCANRLAGSGIAPVGVACDEDNNAWAPRYFSLGNGATLALIALSDVETGAPDNAQIASASERPKVSSAIAQARARAGCVIVMVHWGTENSGAVTEEQRVLARWLIDQGVDAVVGSHPHCLQPLDFYHGRPIAYSLGNLVFDGAPTVTGWNRSALFELKIAGGKIISTRLLPIVLTDGLPVAATLFSKEIAHK